jgi:hypothetical protein
MEMMAVAGFDGAVGEVEIRCAATEGDPLMEVFRAPNVQQCHCSLADFSKTVKEVWVARRQVIARMKTGETPPFFEGKWNWATAEHLLE